MNLQVVTTFLLLTTMMMPLSKSDSPQLGSEADPIRQRLFACQSMEVLVQGLKLDGRPGPFQTFADAVALAKVGRKEEAKSRLHSILGLPNLETRIQLWVWSALRELGEQPNANSGKEVLGVVIEVPVRGAYDTLAGYQDGSARYLNFSGKAVFWDKHDASIKSLCERLIASTISESSRAITRKDTVLPKSGTQVTLLTRSGMYVIVEPPQSIVAAGSALMVELMQRVKETETTSAMFMKIPAGTTVYIGPPAKPMPQEISDAIGTELSKIPEIVEAHLPMIYVKGQIDRPAQVLVIVLKENEPSPLAKVMEALRAVLPTNSHMDVLESGPGDPNLSTIRATGTQLSLNRKLQ